MKNLVHYQLAVSKVKAHDHFTFFHADLILSGANWKLFLASDWIMTAQKNESKFKVLLLGSLFLTLPMVQQYSFFSNKSSNRFT